MMKTVDLQKISDLYNARSKKIERRIVICAGTGCVANGSLKVYDAMIAEAEKHGVKIVISLKDESDGAYLSKSGCQGFCQVGPLVTIFPENILYTAVKPADAAEIIQKTIINGDVIERLLYLEPNSGKRCSGTDEIPFYTRQSRFVIKNCGFIDPEDINEYIAQGGYAAAEHACNEMSDSDVCNFVLDAGLRGRGGGGFPAGRKWDAARQQPQGKKYVICNGDEGDPGAFMDRSIMEGNPHSIIEGLIIAARAIGADQGYVYVRMEYPLAVKRMKKAVEDARAFGILGTNILGSVHNFDLTVMEGAGAFVCGEETALMASIEGRRGMPIPKPPFPAESGLFGCPTIINNVETLSTVPLIFSVGVDEFKKIGTENSRGTKAFALTGHVMNTGLIEVPFGATLREIVGDIAGGVVANDGTSCGTNFKAVQIGGPSGGCLTQEHLDLPLDFDSLKSIGAMIGSGGLVVMNHDTCMVNVARFFMQFTQNESCGKCVLCREGTRQMLHLMDDIVEGRATEATIPLLEELAMAVKKGSLCALGKTAPNPVIATLRYFRDEYDAHVKGKCCPTGECKALAKYTISEELCKECGLCKKKCPVGAIAGERGKKYSIDTDKCIKCDACIDACKFSAIIK